MFDTVKKLRQKYARSNGNGKALQPAEIPDEMRVFMDNANRTLRDISAKAQEQYAGERSITKVYGYKEEGARSFDTYWDYAKTMDIAGRIVTMIPRSCWRAGAWLAEDEDTDEKLLEDEMRALANAGLFRFLERADVLNRLGASSVLLINVPDGLGFEQEAGTATRTDNIFQASYFAPYPEPSVVVTKRDMQKDSARYGQPLIYTLTPNQPSTSSRSADVRQPVEVHWTRIVHLAEGELGTQGEGTPALEPILNRLDDWNKAIGGAGEAFYRNARRVYLMNVDKDARITAEQWDTFKEDAEAFNNELKDIIGLSGAKIDPVSVQTADPQPTVRAALLAIAAATGIPERILTGEGPGQLAGNEDKASYNQLIADRQNQVCSMWLLDALKVFGRAGVIDLPPDVVVRWPVAQALNEQDAADVEKTEAETEKLKVETVAAYADSAAPAIIPRVAFLKEFLGLSDDDIVELDKENDGLLAMEPPEGEGAEQGD